MKIIYPINMTIQETKKDMLLRGMVITEFISNDTPNGTIGITVVKFDTDGLRVSADAPVEVENYIDVDKYSEIIKSRASHIENYITNRHSRNINACQHETVMIGSKVCCSLCMGKFGDKIVLDIRGN
jgi:hypothetical protein